jgi:nucleoside-diphosphate-sugar epimerase
MTTSLASGKNLYDRRSIDCVESINHILLNIFYFSKMSILITGAGGFIGQALAKALADSPGVESLVLTDVVEPAVPYSTKINITALKADLTSRETCQSLLSTEFTHVYLLHGIMSGASEANLSLGLAVNVDSMRNILDVLREKHESSGAKPVRIVYPSSLAVFGGPDILKSPVTESTIALPQSSYGAQKHICEVLFNDFSRRGIVDACIVRLPTIIVRPGKPSGAASSFCSGIVREPLKGEQSLLPVSRELKLWVCSTRTIIRNLVQAKGVQFAGDTYSRIVNLPGVTVTVQEILDGLKAVGGEKALEQVVEKPDLAVQQIVGSWPAIFDIKKALSMGFHPDGDLAQTIREYIEDYGHNAS